MKTIVDKIKQSLRYDEFHEDGDSISIVIDRYRRHDHGGGDDGDDWLDDHEIDADFRQGVSEHKHKLSQVNEMLKENGYKPTANFDLGEKDELSVIASYQHRDFIRQQGIPYSNGAYKNYSQTLFFALNHSSIYKKHKL